MSQTVKLSDGIEFPLLGLGTWLSKPGEVETAVVAAVEAGYRHIDGAYLYLNEAEVGKALKTLFSSGKVQRKDLIITSKLWNTRHNPINVRPSLMESLDMLGLDYVDIYLIHWPYALQPGGAHFPTDADGNLLYEEVHYLDTWKALEACVDEGLIKTIGLSNFNSLQVQDVLDHCRIKPTILQVEINLYFQQHQLVKFCQDRGLVVVAYSSFGSPTRPRAPGPEESQLEDPVLLEVAKRVSKSPAQVILRWLLQRNIAVIPKSVTPSRIVHNSQIWDFTLSDEDMKLLNSRDRNYRSVVPCIEKNGVIENVAMNATHYPFLAEF